MIARFTGPDGQRLLVEAIRSQELVAGDATAAEQLAQASTVHEFGPGEFIIREGGPENDVFFICSGTVVIRVAGRNVAERRSGQHVGEMALLDPGAPRSADVIATTSTVVAKLPERTFAAIAETSPQLWRRLAQHLGTRLRQRNTLLRPVNDVPRMFIGCSSEALYIARAIQEGLRHDPIHVSVWTDGVFVASRYPLESLTGLLSASDFAVLALSPDDIISSRGTDMNAPRDNVIFELGLFMGSLGRDRTFSVVPRSVDLKIPSDLLGLTPIMYSTGGQDTLPARIAPVCNELRRVIGERGAR